MGTEFSQTTKTNSGSAALAVPELVIESANLTKWFGGTLALDEVSLDIKQGEIHALVGENGAGKSTFLGILSGRVVPTSGDLSIFGEPLQFGNPRASRQSGVSTIYQELTMVPALSAEANVFLGQEMGRGPALSKRQMAWFWYLTTQESKSRNTKVTMKKSGRTSWKTPRRVLNSVTPRITRLEYK